MRLSSLCIWLLLFYGTPADSDEVNLLDYSGFGPCDVTLTPEEPCEQEGDEINCPYLFNVPPLTIHLPKQLRELERIVDELQTLKDNVDELRRMCADCTTQITVHAYSRARSNICSEVNSILPIKVRVKAQNFRPCPKLPNDLTTFIWPCKTT
ncbi:hypothetical protein D4764_13G0001730 [Takifugu flavidus]|uniref:Uncharacterized protein n=1 Tax=Takifugu flavidus TaxID=433684 RepID=A0A5C6P9L9_9TELE|nr:hypothetical protein D4764_13G0001730 [Takifugu flavidus]